MESSEMTKNRLSLKKISVAMIGIFLVCIGVAFNNNTGLGNDPVGIIYDGLRSFFFIFQLFSWDLFRILLTLRS